MCKNAKMLRIAQIARKSQELAQQCSGSAIYSYKIKNTLLEPHSGITHQVTDLSLISPLTVLGHRPMEESSRNLSTPARLAAD